MAHIEKKSCEDVQVQRDYVSQRQHQHHHVDHMTCEGAKLALTSVSPSFSIKKENKGNYWHSISVVSFKQAITQ